MLRIARVGGQSMSPTLEDGDFVVVLGGLLMPRPRRGDVVLVQHPQLGAIVKRVAGVDAAGEHVELEGDGALSCSRQSLGSVARGAILGRAVLRIARGRRGTSRIGRGTNDPPRPAPASGTDALVDAVRLL